MSGRPTRLCGDECSIDKRPNGSSKKNLLITGLPGSGKTTLIRKIFAELKDLNPVGFYTTEIRVGGIRKGFELISFDGRKGLFSHVDIKSVYRVGRYKVDVKGFENFLAFIPFLDPSAGLFIIDEIGKMECLSDQFKRRLKQILGSKKWGIATIALKGSGFIEEIKNRSDIKLFEITQNNRDSLLSEILKEVRTAFPLPASYPPGSAQAIV